MTDRPVSLRLAVAADVPDMLRVRAAVKENRLVSRVIGPEEVQEAIERTGRGWVAEVDGQLAGFAIGNLETGNIWALFMDPPFEGRGLGRGLHDTMVNALLGHGLARLHLSTDPGTRAARFYRRAGWRELGPVAGGETAFEWIAAEAPRAPRPELPIRMIAEADAESFRACLDTVAREKRYLAQTEALPLARIQAFVKDSVAQDAVQFVALMASVWSDGQTSSPAGRTPSHIPGHWAWACTRITGDGAWAAACCKPASTRPGARTSPASRWRLAPTTGRPSACTKAWASRTRR